MFKIFFYFGLVLLFAGCMGEVKPQIKPNQKVFEQEDAYILFALRAEEVRDFKSASELFEKLYSKSEKKEYLYRFLQDMLIARDEKSVIKKVDELTKGSFDDHKLIRIKILALIQLNKLEDAKNIALKLVALSKETGDYVLLSDIYIKLKKYDTALKYLESAYTKNYNEEILDKMSILLYVNLQRKKDAIAQLETHTRVHGCSKLICMRLIGFYSDENNVDGLLSTYLRFYRIDKNDEIAKRIVQIYGYKKEYVKLIDFLKESGSDDELLLQLYVNFKKYKEASSLSYKIYKENDDIKYLAQSAIYEYESTSDTDDKVVQKRVIEKLKKVVQEEENPVYLNYLGYLLIDHNIAVKDGISYVKRALKIDPKSAFYLDSLAWGYYKLGMCKKAYKIIIKATKLKGGDDKEVLKHVEKIKKCMNKKVKKRGRK